MDHLYSEFCEKQRKVGVIVLLIPHSGCKNSAVEILWGRWERCEQGVSGLGVVTIDKELRIKDP